MDNLALKDSYVSALSAMPSLDIKASEDKYSGVFLAHPFDDYWTSSVRTMIIGRETNGWNTNNGKNTIGRVIDFGKQDRLGEIVDESFTRYSWHLLDKPNGEMKKKHRSHFQRFYNRLAKEVDVSPYGLIYANLFAWDFDGGSPSVREDVEFEEIKKTSLLLLSELIKFARPDVLIFAVGCNRTNDDAIKQLFSVYFEPHKTTELVSKKYWKFESAGMECFRIAHPRAMSGEHPLFRDKVVSDIKSKVQSKPPLE